MRKIPKNVARIVVRAAETDVDDTTVGMNADNLNIKASLHGFDRWPGREEALVELERCRAVDVEWLLKEPDDTIASYLMLHRFTGMHSITVIECEIVLEKEMSK